MYYENIMKKSLVWFLGLVILAIMVWLFFLNKDEKWWDIMNGSKMGNEVSSYSVSIQERWEFPWEDIYVYDNNDKLVLSLEDKNQPQYFYVLYWDFIVLDSGTSVSMREMLVYNIPSGNKIFQTDYFPWNNGLVLKGNEIKFYKKIDDSLLWNYTLPDCENEYDNGYIESYGYTIWEDQVNDLGDIQCAYFE